ncbi:phenylacetate-CoA oxygenase/reductase subunit PaaK [Kaustia mangrovi]|uniref:Phenylacetate-CoA oxygenase/reductase subunit PaaK n=1 Tax=Kaustia mangrovi TaxID=2593653 RepID=A0A7S8HD05_9HYPH|nr:1,2-phenylacetyl-CoA epoxidase subunit PaaE [Kaustia mangrovi]QPC44191.1 phenylacetate-CoA oxygenase/reductase subunit PaaK [Kaustia mangrovi]
MAEFETLSVRDVRKETPDAVSVAFDVPPELEDRFGFTPGQYLTLRATIAGEDVRRTYSICSGLDDGEIRVAVKRVEGGRFSGFVNEALKPGMTLDVMAPEGRFTCPATERAGHDYVAFAAGSGVTPVLSIVKTVLAREPDSRFTFFYGNRDTASIIFREALEDLKDRYLDRFTLIHVLSREGQDVDILHGRLSEEKVRAFAQAGLFDPATADRFFLCGPGDMIDTVETALAGLGVEARRIAVERFTPAGDAAPAAPSERAQEAAREGIEVEVVLDGATRRFELGEEDASIVDAGHRAGIEIPYSCKGGMCCTCRCKLVEGEVEMAANYALEPWELEAGFVLGCQSRPLTKKVVLDFDAA